MNPTGEAELVARCRTGEANAWDMLFDAHYAPTGRFVFQLSPDLTREDVEEICQDVFLSVIKNIAGFQGQSRLQTWIFPIAANKTKDFIERQRAAKRGGGQTPISLQAPNQDYGLVLDPPSPAAGPDMQLLQGEDVALVRCALCRLGEPCREIIELRYFADLSYEEIASALRLNPKTVSSRLSKCLDRLEMIARPLFRSGKPHWEKPTPFSV